jgi:uncharacterized protein YbjT (DUF2867 family)
MYVITGATGNTGRRIAEILLLKGVQVKVIGRSADKLKSIKEAGAETAVGDIEDEAFLKEAFKGATAVYAMIPPNLHAENVREYQNRVGDVIARAIANAGVKHVVNLSSLGAHLPDKTGPITGLHDQERRLNKLEGVNVLHLRPTYFFENLLAFIPMIRNMGICGSALKGDIPVPMIASQDIAKEAAERLAKLDFTGKAVKDLLGQRHISMNEAMKILGKAARIEDLKYVEFPYEEAEKAIRQAGLSPDMARSYVELQKCVNEGIAITDAKRTAENTTETPIEKFAATWGALYDTM